MTVDRRQNPDRTLVRGTRISGYRKLQCNYYKCVKQTHSQSGVRKRSKNCCVSCLYSLVCSAPHQEKHTLKTHSLHTLAHKLSEGNIRIGSVSGCREDGREVDRLRPISGVSGGAPPRPDRYTRPPLTRLGLIRIY